MASRDLRYEWFKKLINDNSIDYVVTAHHSDDNYETIIFNLLKTTGYKGLIGIPYSYDNIIRPLINVEKKDILDYAKNKSLRWREDKSNLENKYSRNIIRNQLLPIISNINPSYKKSILESSKRIGLVEKFISGLVEKFILKIWKKHLTASSKTFVDAKTKLQEYSLKKYKKLPIYKLLENSGPRHKPIIKVGVRLESTKYFNAKGSSKKDAEQKAASLLLESINKI